MLSFLQKGISNLTPEEEKEFLEIDKEKLPKEMYQVIFDLVKTKIETGELPNIETYVKNYKKSVKITLPQLEFLGQAGNKTEQGKQGDEPR